MRLHCIVLRRARMRQMFNLLDHPVFALVVSLFIFWISAWIGGACRKRQGDLDEDIYHDFVFVLSAALTLLGLIVAFTLVMAVNRYDQRKNYEEEETNAIGTEFLRAALLPDADAARVRALLKRYLDQRSYSITRPATNYRFDRLMRKPRGCRERCGPPWLCQPRPSPLLWRPLSFLA